MPANADNPEGDMEVPNIETKAEGYIAGEIPPDGPLFSDGVSVRVSQLPNNLRLTLQIGGISVSAYIEPEIEDELIELLSD